MTVVWPEGLSHEKFQRPHRESSSVTTFFPPQKELVGFPEISFAMGYGLVKTVVCVVFVLIWTTRFQRYRSTLNSESLLSYYYYYYYYYYHHHHHHHHYYSYLHNTKHCKSIIKYRAMMRKYDGLCDKFNVHRICT